MALIWLAILNLQIYKIFMISLIPSCHLPQSGQIFLCQLLEQSIKCYSCSARLSHNKMRPRLDLYYLLKICCNRILDQKYKHPKKETFLAEHQQCVQHLTPGWNWHHQPFNTQIAVDFDIKGKISPLPLSFLSEIVVLGILAFPLGGSVVSS